MHINFETPVLFLIFNRPDTTQEVFDQIKKVQPKYLFIASDGPREWVAGEKSKCDETRKIINKIDWDCEVKTLFRNNNLGCGLAVSSAITWFFEQVTEGIILEDDCYPDLSFFYYCQELLIRYRDVHQVMLIGGNNFQHGITRGNGSYYFTQYPEIWGWASWRRVWENYDFKIFDLVENFNKASLQHVFKSNAERKYWYQKFLQTKQGKSNTWDYQLMYAILKSKGIAISPQVNLVKNIGIHNNPTHLTLRDSKKELHGNSLSYPLKHPEIAVDKAADQYTFSQIYSRSPRRLFRLIRENGVRNVLLYTFRYLFR